MKTTIKVVNSSTEAVKVGIDKGVSLEVGAHEYTLKKELADEVVRTASVLDFIEVQLISKAETATPSTVDGAAEIKELTAELEAAKALNLKLAAELESALTELETLKKQETASAGGDAVEEKTGSEPVAKKATKRTASKTENKG